MWLLTGPPTRSGDNRSRYLWELTLYYSDAPALGISVQTPSGNAAAIRRASLTELLALAHVVSIGGGPPMPDIGVLVTPLPGVKPHVRGGSVEVVLSDTALMTRFFKHTITEARLTFVDRDNSSHNIQVYTDVRRIK